MKTNLTTALAAHVRTATPMVAVLTALATAPSTMAQVREAWAARYGGVYFDGPAQQGCALDGAGNLVVVGVYAAGATVYNSNFLTLEYDALGQVLWSRQYGSTGFDQATSVVLDSAGNVYVTGFSYASASAFYHDIATVKYDDNGLQLWVSRFNGPANRYDGAFDVAVDGAGNVYVVGHTTNATNHSQDFVTVKYDAAGVQQWTAFHAGPANGEDVLTAVGVDSAGNAYVTGRSELAGGGSECLTIKYDPSGNQVWLRSIGAGPTTVGNLVIDAADNVYVSASGVTVKYDAQGSVLWSQPIGSGTGIVLDNAGGVLVLDPGAVSKLDVAGNVLWSSAFAGPSGGAHTNALAMDVQGSVYVTGWTFGSNQNFLTIKYDSTGNQVWLEEYDGPGTFDRTDQANAIAVAAPDLVFVTGGSAASGSASGNYYSDWATIKYERATLGVAYCTPANGNSTGAPASAEATGSAVVQDDDLTLWATALPQHQFTYFLASRSQGFVASPGGSQGTLCLGGSIGRFVGPGQIQNSGVAGAVALPVDLTALPTPTGLASVAPGETWNFQAWYRDANPTSTSNFTDAVSVAFQ